MPHSPQFLDIMQKLSQGEVPSDIKQIDDSPTDQNAIPLGAPASRQTSLKVFSFHSLDLKTFF